MGRLREFWFGEADVAPLALFRILFGLQLFNWFWQLFPNLTAFFTDEGILPRHAQALSDADRFSLLNLSGDWWLVVTIWLVSCAIALGLTLGWHTRAMSLLAFALVSSFSWRNPLILDGSDLVFRLVPLWLAFTPAGERWSIDALRRREAPVVSGWALPIRILELQIGWIYLATGLEKLGGIDWISGTAAYYALQLEHTFARSWAYAFALDPMLSRLISWYTIAVELSFLPLAMLPFRTTRLLAALGAGAMQLGILLLMNVGNFPLVMLAACVLFVPPHWIRRLMRADVNVAPSPARARPRVAGALLILIAATAFITAVPSVLEPIRPSGDVASVLRSLSLDQRWDMFSPNAARSDGWLVAPATLADGTRLDLFSDRGADDRSERYSDPLYTRWAKVTERIASGFYSGYRPAYASYFCRARNSHLRPGQSPLASFELIYVERTIQAPEKGPPLISENELWSQQC
ncbi:MAG: HTTM domain-containing protein [Chloroflexota bacterium]|nr:HTTM domain-containing protein [Chloroflexota bacterium]